MDALKRFYRKYKAEIKVGVVVFVMLMLINLVKKLIK
jgi:hypothetical protein